MWNHFEDEAATPDKREEARREASRLSFDNEWEKAMAWWARLPDGVRHHYTMSPRAMLLELWHGDHKTKALANVLFGGVSSEAIYPTTSECRALVGDLILAERVGRPAKVRAYGKIAEERAWIELCDRLRRPRCA